LNDTWVKVQNARRLVGTVLLVGPGLFYGQEKGCRSALKKLLQNRVLCH